MRVLLDGIFSVFLKLNNLTYHAYFAKLTTYTGILTVLHYMLRLLHFL